MLLVVGSLVIDEVFLGEGRRRIQAGGAALYSSIAAKKMNLEVGVVSKVGYDYPREYLEEMRTQGIDLSRVKILQDSPTTRFVLRYREEKRRLYLKGRCKPIEPQDLRRLRAEAVYITPVLDEVPRETVLEISRRCETLSLDPQGYVREGKGEEAIEPRPWFDAEVLSRLKIFKSSMEELHWIAGSGDPWTAMERIRSCGPEIVMVTWGRKGALMLAEEGRYHVPAFPTTKAIDPTGAGDAFMGGFLSQYLRGRDPLWSASVGAAVASCIVETLGCRLQASVREIHERANWVWERVKEM